MSTTISRAHVYLGLAQAVRRDRTWLKPLRQRGELSITTMNLPVWRRFTR